MPKLGFRLEFPRPQKIIEGFPSPLRVVENGQGYNLLKFYYKDGDKTKRVQLMEHRVIVERHLGRPLTTNETIHHKNGIRNDNRIENLEVRFGNHGTGATHCPHCGGSLGCV